MTAFAFAPPEAPSVPIAGRAERFPVRRIFCVGRNYAAHAREMGLVPDRGARPTFFTKPADAIVTDGADVAYPTVTRDLHHEVELVIATGGEGADLSPAAAERLIFGWAVGVDLTRRDLQAECKAASLPWDVAKAFDDSAPIGAITPVSDLARPAGRIRLSVNGTTRQDADLADMIWSPVECVVEASKLWALKPGDLIFTGTPEGVAALVRGDRVVCGIDGLQPLAFTVV